MTPSGESAKSRKPVLKDTNFYVVLGITLTSALGFSAISPAFPRMIQELKISPQDIGVLVSVYTLPSFVLTPVLGVLADRSGRKRILAPLLILFGVAGGACALARDFNTLLMLRFIQGVGSACLLPLSFTVMCDLYQDGVRTSALCYNSSIMAAGIASFPALGGALAMLGWSYPFLLSLVGIPVGLIVLFWLKSPEPAKGGQFSLYLGSLWQSVKNLKALGLFISCIFTSAIIFGLFTPYLPILLANSFGASPLIIGLIISITFLLTAITSWQLGKLAKVYGREANLLKVAFIFYALALFLIPLITNLWLILIPAIILGVGHGFNIPGRITLSARLAPQKHLAAFLSVAEMAFLFGETVGPIIMGVILSTWGMGSAFFAGAVLSISIFAIAIISLR